MNLLKIREQFIELSGRSDLVKSMTNYEDNGADWYIRAASKELDRERLQTGEAPKIAVIAVPAEGWVVKLDRMRSIFSVRVRTGNTYSVLKRLSRAGVYSTFPKLGYDISAGAPLFYYPINFQYLSEDAIPDAFMIEAAYEKTIDEITGIIILPPPDTAIQVEVEGYFYSALLENDEDTNFWATVEPDILVMGAMRELERSYRNMSGAREWTSHIEQKLLGIDMDRVEQTISATSKMRG